MAKNHVLSYVSCQLFETQWVFKVCLKIDKSLSSKGNVVNIFVTKNLLTWTILILKVCFRQQKREKYMDRHVQLSSVDDAQSVLFHKYQMNLWPIYKIRRLQRHLLSTFNLSSIVIQISFSSRFIYNAFVRYTNRVC